MVSNVGDISAVQSDGASERPRLNGDRRIYGLNGPAPTILGGILEFLHLGRKGDVRIRSAV